MSGFSADWLTLRASADARARDPGLAEQLGACFALCGAVRVLDLGAGTGANLRATSHLIPATQHWVLADNDSTLLARAEPPPGTTLERQVIDLAGDLSPLFDPAPGLVTASAFLDLCGAAWIDGLIARLAAIRAVLYAVLSFDGRESWEPPHPLDEAQRVAFHADQKRDKGLGPALGPRAHDYACAALRRHGYRVHEAQSDWTLQQPRDAEMIAALAQGSANAVQKSIGAKMAETWREARAGSAKVTIGHRDLLALPPR